MKPYLLIPAIALVGCVTSTPMQIDLSHIGNAQATLRIEAPGLSEHVSKLRSMSVDVSLSRFPGCHTSATSAKSLTPIGEATLTPKESVQTVTIPAGVELAIYAESVEFTALNDSKCANVLRFFSEPGKRYVLSFKPHESFGFGYCEMQILTSSNGSISPVASAHYGVYTGDDLDLCK